MTPTRTPNPSPLAGEDDAWTRSVHASGEGPGSAAVLDVGGSRGPSPGHLPCSRPSSPVKGEGKGSAVPQMRERARALRTRMTNAERKLWFALRDRRSAGFKFRRQVPIDRFIADFICFEARLVVEVDGGQHAESLRDQWRDRWFAENGFRVVRFWNNEVLSNLEGVLTVLLAELEQGR
jgi:very-short-patch-repair endonuclease